MTTDYDKLMTIPDAKPVRVFLPLVDRVDMYRVQAIYRKSQPPVFSLFFKPGILPTAALNKDKPCIISVDMGGPTTSLEANITDISSDQHLVLTAIKAISHEQMREFFRVDAVAHVIGSSFSSSIHSLVGNNDEQWSLTGQTIDISGSGILATFTEKPPTQKKIQLEITLPTENPETIKVVARPVRTIATEDNKYDVAYHFEEIDTEDRDKIIGCCLEIQRRLLRLKVQVKDQ